MGGNEPQTFYAFRSYIIVSPSPRGGGTGQSFYIKNTYIHISEGGKEREQINQVRSPGIFATGQRR